MAQKGPGKAHREGMTLLQMADKFRDEAASRQWIEQLLWPHGPFCPACGSFDVQSDIKHKTMTHRCRSCDKRPMFSVRKGTVLEGTKMGYRIWAIGIYLFMTNIKGISSMRLHRELGITQKTAWFMLHRLREAVKAGKVYYQGPVEVDETYIGGKRSNMPAYKRQQLTGRGTKGKAAVVGIKDRDTKEIHAQVVPHTDGKTLRQFVTDHTAPGADVFTDEASAYIGLDNHSSVCHSAGEFVRNIVHTNGIENFWSLLKRGYHGTYHKMSTKHLDRYVNEFAQRSNIREEDTLEQMSILIRRAVKKRLTYKKLIA